MNIPKVKTCIGEKVRRKFFLFLFVQREKKNEATAKAKESPPKIANNKDFISPPKNIIYAEGNKVNTSLL
jgi:hypothetical protein